VVAKLPAADPTSRATAAAVRSYEIEVSFYRELAPRLPVRNPHCYVALHDPATDDFILVLEDLAPATQGDQLAGCSADQAAIAVDELPRLHAPLWGDPSLAALPWLSRSDAGAIAMTTMLVTNLHDGFRARYHERLDPDVLALCERFMPRLASYLANRDGPWTVAHGDYRLDNLLFGVAQGGPAVAVVDWQTVTHGPGISDLSYFIGAGLLIDDRRTHEEQLVRSYHAALDAAGIALAWDDCWLQYRRHTFAGLVMAVAASMLVEQTARGDDMFMVMADRHGRHALDLDAERLLD
jgi:aminoglycoside/choline kinase family phosphotransferase